uniref:IS110 family transposase n=1 Tax=Paraburkholderia heleia TaxID=634127 RepID=UPI002ADE0B6C|nr:IS110 family transposase [Paraburkholderia heleia]
MDAAARLHSSASDTERRSSIPHPIHPSGRVCGRSSRQVTRFERKCLTPSSDADAHITILLRRLGSMYLEQLAALQRWIDELALEIADIFKRNESCQRLATVPGIGPLVATALFSGVGDPLQFKNGRQFAAWLGLTSKQRSSGGKSKLGRITKHGDTYLRTLLVQGARAVMRFVGRRDDRHSCWIKAVMQRRHVSVAAIALANKTARIAWAILASNDSFKLA